MGCESAYAAHPGAGDHTRPRAPSPASAASTRVTQPADGSLPDSENLEPLFQTIIEKIPAPTYDETAPLQAHVTNLDASPFLGRLALLRLFNGTIRKGQTVAGAGAQRAAR